MVTGAFKGFGATIFPEMTTVHPFKSVAVTLYGPPPRLETVAVVAPLLHR